MNRPLWRRPVDLRLKLAYMADASDTTFVMRAPGSAGYSIMWGMINRWYELLELNTKPDAVLEKFYQDAIKHGFRSKIVAPPYRDKRVAPQDILMAQKRWNDRGWFQHEHERAETHRKSIKYGTVALKVCTLFVAPAAWETLFIP